MEKALFNRLKHIDRLIRVKGTGNAQALAKRIGISRPQLYLYLRVMKERGAPIKYDKARETYYYIEEGTFVCEFISTVH